MQCISSLGFDRFILIQEGKQNLSLTLDSQQLTKMLFQAHFVLGSVTANHNGTFRCYGCFRNDAQVWSTSSNPLDIQVSGKDPNPAFLKVNGNSDIFSKKGSGLE